METKDPVPYKYFNYKPYLDLWKRSKDERRFLYDKFKTRHWVVLDMVLGWLFNGY